MIKLIQPSTLEHLPAYQGFLSRSKDLYNELQRKYQFLDYRDYQYEHAALYSVRKKNICAARMGIGKTIIAGLTIATIYQEFSRPGQIQVVAPNNLSAKSRWLVDLKKIDYLADKVEFINSEKDALNSTKPIWVYTIDFIKRKSKNITRQNRNTLARYFYKKHLYPSFLIMDECHNIKAGTQRAEEWAFYLKKVKRTLFLSGTLSDGRLDLLYFIWNLCYKKKLNFNLDEFKQEFGSKVQVTTNYAGGHEPIIDVKTRYLPHLSTDKIPEYVAIANKLAHRVTYDDPKVLSCITLPREYRHIEYVIPTKEHTQYYRDVLDISRIRIENLAAREKASVNTLGLLNPLIEASSITPSTIRNKKLEYLLDVCAGSDKVVVFTSYINTSRYLTEEISKRFKTVRLYAVDKEAKPTCLSQEKREDIISEFLFNADVKVGVFSINLASESIDLQSASTVIFYDLPWQSIKVQQAVYRAVRPGSAVDCVDVLFLANSGMIDSHILELYKTKVLASKLLLDFNPSNTTAADLSILNPAELARLTLKTESDDLLWNE